MVWTIYVFKCEKWASVSVEQLHQKGMLLNQFGIIKHNYEWFSVSLCGTVLGW